MIGLATSAEFPSLYSDDTSLVGAIAARGVEPVPVVWDDAAVDWASFDLVVIRSTWDYHQRRDAFVAWANGVPRLENAARVVAWNTDKTYLRELAEQGVPVVPTAWDVRRLADVPWDDVVVKPAVSAGARNTLHCRRDSAEGQTLLDRINADGTSMVQPYLDGVEGYGERSLLFCEGRLTHAVRRNPALSLEGESRYDARLVEATDAEVEVAERALKAVGETLLYARVDLVPDETGEPVLIELEVTEPQLFLRFSPSAAETLADAIVARAGNAGRGRMSGS